METDIKLIDLRKENLNNVKEAIRLASALGAKNFKLFVNPMFVRNGLVSPRIVPMSIDTPPKTQMLLSLVDLKNLKKTVDFAKKILTEDGEVTVEEKTTPVALAPTAVTLSDAKKEAAEVTEKAAEAVAPAVAEEEVTTTEEALAESEDLLDEPTEEALAEETGDLEVPVVTSKKRKSKKAAASEETD